MSDLMRMPFHDGDYSWRRDGTMSMRGTFRVDQTEGLGLLLSRLGLHLHTCELEQRCVRFEHIPGADGLCTSFDSLGGIALRLAAELKRDATLSLLHRDTPLGVSAPVVLHLDYEDSTREAAEELLPVIVEQWRSQNGDFTHRAAALLGMLLMEMLWAAAS